jgi:precorrin-2 dehydrogenase/sirohydrochlorin ferrochelatase
VSYYPVYLDLQDRLTVVVGGSALAEEKARGLLAVGARVKVIAETVTVGLAELAVEEALVHLARAFAGGDLAGAAMAIVTESDPGVRDAVFAEATAGNVLVNTVDDLPRCNWIAPSIVRRGHLTIAISTAGKAPVLAVRLRQWLEKEIGAEHERFLEMASEVRAPLALRHPDFAERRARWYRLIDSDVLELLRRGDEVSAQGRFSEILGVAPPRDVSPELPDRAPGGAQIRPSGSSSCAPSSLDPAARASWLGQPLPAEQW